MITTVAPTACPNPLPVPVHARGCCRAAMQRAVPPGPCMRKGCARLRARTKAGPVRGGVGRPGPRLLLSAAGGGRAGLHPAKAQYDPARRERPLHHWPGIMSGFPDARALHLGSSTMSHVTCVACMVHCITNNSRGSATPAPPREHTAL